MKKVLASPTFKYLFWLGPMLIIAGLVAGFIAGNWIIPGILVAIGVGICGGWLLQQKAAGGNIWAEFLGRRSTQVGANAIIALVALLVILGLVNVLAVRSVARIDFTENQVFTLSPETKTLMQNFPDPVKVWVFVPQGNPQDKELLENYRRLNRNFSYEFVDPQQRKTLAKRLEVKSAGDVIVEVPEKNRKQYAQTIPVVEAGDPREAAFRLSESKLTNALEQVKSDRQTIVYMLEGHGERPIQASQGALSEAMSVLKDKAFDVQPLNLVANPDQLKEAKVVVIAGPRKAFLQPEVKALMDYQKAGGSLLLMIDPETKPGLDDLLKPWGVSLEARLIVDEAGQFAELGPTVPVVTQYGDHPITKDFGNSYSFYPLARPVDVDPKDGVKSVPLLYSSEKSWAESQLADNAKPAFDPTRDRPGPFAIAVALTRPTEKPAPQPKPSPSPTASPQASPSPAPSPTPSPQPSPSPSASPTNGAATEAQPEETRMVVIGNSSFAADGLFNSAQVVNGDLFLNSVRWLSKQDQPVLSVRPKEPKNRRITLAGGQKLITVSTALVLLPLLGFGSAAWLWWKRR